MLVILSYSPLPAQVHSFGPWRLLHSKTKAPGTRCTTSPQKATRWEVKPWQVYDIRMRVWPYNDHLRCTNFANSAIPKVFRVSCADFARSGSALFRSKPLINKTSATKLGATCSVGIIATHWQHALATKFCWFAKAQSHHFSVGSLEKLEWKSSLIIAHRNLRWPPGSDIPSTRFQQFFHYGRASF